MKLEKELIVKSFLIERCINAPYIIEACSEDYTSKLTINNEILHKKLGIQNPLGIEGSKILVRLDSRLMQKGKGRCITDLTDEDLIIGEIGRSESQKRRGLSWEKSNGDPIFHVSNSLSYFVNIKTLNSGGIHFSELPCPFYDLNLNLDEQEYNLLKELPANAVMRIGLSLKK